MKVRTPYNYDRKKASTAGGLQCLDSSRTKQSFKDECDINTIMRKFGQTGQLPTNVRMPTYQDFQGPFDFQMAMNAIRQAQESFAAMPADVRKRFHNDPAEFVDFCSDEANRQEAEKLGLVSEEALQKAADLARATAAAAKPPTPQTPTPEAGKGA